MLRSPLCFRHLRSGTESCFVALAPPSVLACQCSLMPVSPNCFIHPCDIECCPRPHPSCRGHTLALPQCRSHLFIPCTQLAEEQAGVCRRPRWGRLAMPWPWNIESFLCAVLFYCWFLHLFVLIHLHRKSNGHHWSDSLESTGLQHIDRWSDEQNMMRMWLPSAVQWCHGLSNDRNCTTFMKVWSQQNLNIVDSY